MKHKFYMDEVRQLINSYLNADISIGKLVEILNENTTPWNEPKIIMPEYDGQYLCQISRSNECGTTIVYQRVLNCHLNKFVIEERETVMYWMDVKSRP